MSVSRLRLLSCGDASSREVVALAGTTVRRGDWGERYLASSSQMGLALLDEVGNADRSPELLDCGPIGFS
jgi:hypothetical protein